jgi:TolA-binding protein
MNMRILFLLFVLVSGVFAGSRDLSLAQKYFRDEVYSMAAEHFRKYLEEKPAPDRIPDARLGLARSLKAEKQWENAVRIYRDFILAHGKHEQIGDVAYELGECLSVLGNHGQAGEYFAQAYQKKHGNPKRKALFFSAREAWQARDYEKARSRAQVYTEKYKSGAELAATHYILAAISDQEQNFEESERQLTLATKAPGAKELQKDILRMRARALVNLQKDKAANQDYQALLQMANRQDSLELQKEYTEFLYSKQQYKLLADFLEPLVNSGLSVQHRLYLVRAQLSLKEAQKALQVLRVLGVSEGQEKIDAAFLEAEALLALNEREAGIEVLVREGERGNRSAWVRVAQVYQKDHMAQQAVRAWYKALDLAQSDEERIPLLLEIARIYEQDLKRYGMARSVYEDFQKNYPDHPQVVQAALGAAYCLEAEERWEEAARAFKAVLEDYPGHEVSTKAQKHYDYLTRFQIRSTDAALHHMLVILEQGENPYKQWNLARILEEDLKEYAKAYAAYEKVLQSSDSLLLKDTLLFPKVWYRKGRLQELLADRSWYEQKPEARHRHQQQAQKDYGQLLQQWPQSSWADDAQFHLLEMQEFNLGAYVEFSRSYPASNRLPQVWLKVGDSYLQQAQTQGVEFAAKAGEFYQKILNEFSQSEEQPRALLGLAQSWINSGQESNARPFLQMLMESELADAGLQAQAHFLLGRLEYKVKNYDAAERLFKEVLFRFQATPSSPRSLIGLALSYQASSRTSEAIQSYRRFIKQYADHEDSYRAFHGLSMIYEQEKRWEDAISVLEHYKKVGRNQERLVETMEKIAKLHLHRNDRPGAIAAYQEGFAFSKEQRDDFFAPLAELYLQEEDFANALNYFSKALQAAKTDRDSLYAWGGLLPSLIMQGKTKKYHKEFDAFKDRFEDDKEMQARSIFYEGRHLMESGQESRARKRFSYLADRFEESTWAGEGSYYLGAIAFKKGSIKGAIKHLEKYLEENPQGRSAVDASFKAGSCYFQMSSFDKAQTEFLKAAASEKASPLMRYRAIHNAAVTSEKLGDWARAATLYERIRNEYSKLQQTKGIDVSIGFAWFRGQNYEAARRYFYQALQDTSHNRRAESHYWYAKSLDNLGKTEEAVAEYLKVNYLYHSDPMWGLTSLFDVGQIYERSGLLDKARKMYQKIVTQDGLHGSLGSRAAKYLAEMDKRYGGTSGTGAGGVINPAVPGGMR